MARRRKIIVWVEDFPPHASDEDIADYVFGALGEMGGCRHPDDPLFGSLNVKEVQIGQQRFIYSNE